VAVKADGSACYSVGEDKQVRAWNLTGDQGAKQIRAMGGAGGAVLKLAQHGKEPWLFSAGADAKIRQYEREKGNQIRELAGHKDYVLSLALNPSGDLLASGGWDGEIRLWNPKDGKLIKVFNASPGLKVVAAPAKP
jgi:WD40 repeat protein